MALFSTIICCINLTENSNDIVQYTRDIAKIDDARVIVVHALPSTAHLLNYVTSRSMVESILDESKARTEKFLKEFVEKNFAGLKAEPLPASLSNWRTKCAPISSSWAAYPPRVCSALCSAVLQKASSDIPGCRSWSFPTT